MPPTQPVPPLRPRNWLERNLKWLIPGVALAFLSCLAALAILLVAFLKSSDAYQGALSRIKSHAGVTAALGAPVHEGFLFTGRINLNNSSGDADLTIPLSGAKGEGTAFVRATRSLGVWHYDQLIVQITDGRTRIDLSDAPQRPAQNVESNAAPSSSGATP
jgi:Cytochrome oxidase complex assembly protein 1